MLAQEEFFPQICWTALHPTLSCQELALPSTLSPSRWRTLTTLERASPTKHLSKWRLLWTTTSFCISSGCFQCYQTNCVHRSWIQTLLGLSSHRMLSTSLLPGSYVLLNWSCWTSRVSCATSSPWFLTLVRTSLWRGRMRQVTSFFIACKSASLERFASYQAAWTRTRRRLCPTSSHRTTSKCWSCFFQLLT